MQQNFRQIEDYPNYIINPEGIVKNNKNGQIKKPTTRHGKYSIKLSKNSTSKNFLLDYLVAKHFLPKDEYQDTIIHIDGNNFNNNVSNLKWIVYNEPDLKQNITEKEKQWVAGFLDGDGCLCLKIDKNKNGTCLLQPYIRFSQSQNDGIPKVLLKAKALFGGCLVKINDGNEKHRIMHALQIKKKDNVKAILQIMIQYSAIKYTQAHFLMDKYHEGQSYPDLESAEEQNEILKNMHHTYKDVKVNENRLTSSYMGGLFDAEGCVCVSTSENLAVSLAQKGSSQLRKCIVEKYGGADNGSEVVWYGTNAKSILFLLYQYCTGKLEQIELGLKYLDHFLVRKEPSEIRKRKLDEREIIFNELKRLKKL